MKSALQNRDTPEKTEATLLPARGNDDVAGGGQVTDEVRQTPSVCFRCDMGIPRRPTGSDPGSATDPNIFAFEHPLPPNGYTMPCYASRRGLDGQNESGLGKGIYFNDEKTPFDLRG